MIKHCQIVEAVPVSEDVVVHRCLSLSEQGRDGITAGDSMTEHHERVECSKFSLRVADQNTG